MSLVRIQYSPLVFYLQRINTIGFFEELLVSRRADEHYFGKVSVRFVFKACDFLSGTNRTMDYGILRFGVELNCVLMFLFVTEK